MNILGKDSESSYYRKKVTLIWTKGGRGKVKLVAFFCREDPPPTEHKVWDIPRKAMAKLGSGSITTF